MIKIWAKIYKEHKITSQTTFEEFVEMDWANFSSYVMEICYNLDISTPVITKQHLFNYAKFNFVKFFPSDFVEPVEFDHLMLEGLVK